MHDCMLFYVNSCADTPETMPEVFCPSADHCLARDSAAIAAAQSVCPVTSQMDEFVLGFRDCANESLRYLEATTAIASDTGEAETSTRGLVDALRTHLIEHEAETIRRRRRHSDDDDELGRSSASLQYAEDCRSLQEPPRRRRRLRVSPTSLHPRRLNHSRRFRYPEEIQTVHLRSKYDSRNVSEAVTTSKDSDCDRNLAPDTSSVLVDDDAAVAAGGKYDQENMDEMRHCASQLSTLASRDVRVGLLLTELFQLMDSDDD